MKRKIFIGLIIIYLILITRTYAMTIVIDPGHGGNDIGATACDGVTYERDINLKIAKYLKEELEKYKDVKVLLTHSGYESDEQLEIYDRAIFARNNNADVLISVHNNSSTTIKNGAEVYVTANTSLPKYNQEMTALGNKVLHNLFELGIANRGVMIRLLDRDLTDVYSDGTIADYYGIIRYAMRGTKIDYGVVWPEDAVSANVQNGEGVPTILIEHCYINSETDFQFVNTNEKLRKIAIADATAVAEHYNLTPKYIDEIVDFNVEETKIFLIEGKTYQINYEVKSNINANPQVEWSSSNANVVTVDTDGKIAGIGNGQATITGSVKDTKIEIPVEVIKLEQEFKLSNEKENSLIYFNLKDPQEELKDIELAEDMELQNTSNIYTNARISLINKTTGDILQSYVCILIGDINGDGQATITDLSKLKMHLVETEVLKNQYLCAADMNQDSKVSITDLSKYKMLLVE